MGGGGAGARPFALFLGLAVGDVCEGVVDSGDSCVGSLESRGGVIGRTALRRLGGVEGGVPWYIGLSFWLNFLPLSRLAEEEVVILGSTRRLVLSKVAEDDVVNFGSWICLLSSVAENDVFILGSRERLLLSKLAEAEVVMAEAILARSKVELALTGSDFGVIGSYSSNGLGELGASKGFVDGEVSSSSSSKGLKGFVLSRKELVDSGGGAGGRGATPFGVTLSKGAENSNKLIHLGYDNCIFYYI